MKFLVDRQVSLAQEFLVEAGTFIAAILVLVTSRKVLDWIARRKDGKKTPIDHIKENIDRSLKELHVISSKNWDIPNSSDSSEKYRGAHHAVQYSEFEGALSSIASVVPILRSSNIDKQKITSIVNKLKTSIHVYKNDTDGSTIIEFDDSGIVWPSDPFYKDLSSCNAKFVQSATKIINDLKDLQTSCEKAFNELTESTDDNTLQDVGTIVNAVSVVSFLTYGTIVGYSSNLEVIENETEME